MYIIDDLILPLDEPIAIAQMFNRQLSHNIIEDTSGTKVDDSYSLGFAVNEGSMIIAARSGTVHQLNVSSDLNYSPKSGEKTDQELVKRALTSRNYLIT